MTALPEFSPIGATATSGDVTPYGRLTDTPVTSFRITSKEDIFQANIALLFAPQEGASHAILGLCLALAGVCGVSKTQLLAERKAVKNAKSELDEDIKFAIAARKAKSVLKKKELLARRHILFKLPPTILMTALPEFSPTSKLSTTMDLNNLRQIKPSLMDNEQCQGMNAGCTMNDEFPPSDGTASAADEEDDADHCVSTVGRDADTVPVVFVRLLINTPSLHLTLAGIVIATILQVKM
jgi:hypothetical protein